MSRSSLRRGQTTFRNFMELAFSLDDLFCRRAALVAGAQPATAGRMSKGEVIWCEA